MVERSLPTRAELEAEGKMPEPPPTKGPNLAEENFMMSDHIAKKKQPLREAGDEALQRSWESVNQQVALAQQQVLTAMTTYANLIGVRGAVLFEMERRHHVGGILPPK